MSTVSELFAPQFLQDGPLTPEIEARMARRLGADSLRYLPVEAVARAIGFAAGDLCQACITGQYPTPCGQELAQIAVDNDRKNIAGRTYETVGEVRQLFLKRPHDAALRLVLQRLEFLDPVQPLQQRGKLLLLRGRRGRRHLALRIGDLFRVEIHQVQRVVGPDAGGQQVRADPAEVLQILRRKGAGVVKALDHLRELVGRNVGDVVLGQDSADRGRIAVQHGGRGAGDGRIGGGHRGGGAAFGQRSRVGQPGHDIADLHRINSQRREEGGMAIDPAGEQMRGQTRRPPPAASRLADRKSLPWNDLHLARESDRPPCRRRDRCPSGQFLPIVCGRNGRPVRD